MKAKRSLSLIISSIMALSVAAMPVSADAQPLSYSNDFTVTEETAYNNDFTSSTNDLYANSFTNSNVLHSNAFDASADMTNWTYTGAELTGDKLKVPAGKNAAINLASLGLKADGTEYEISFDISVDSFVSSGNYNRVGVNLEGASGILSVFDILSYGTASKAEVSLLGQWKGANGVKAHSVKFKYNPQTGLISASVGDWASQSKTWGAGAAATTLRFLANGQDTFYLDNFKVAELVSVDMSGWSYEGSAIANNKLKVPTGKVATLDLAGMGLKADGTEYEVSFDISVDSYVNSTNYNRVGVEMSGTAGTLYLFDILSYGTASKAEVALLGQWKGADSSIKAHSVKFNYNPKTGLVAGAVGDWATQSKTWGAGSAATTLRFRANGQDTFYIDNVKVTEKILPDMSEWAYEGTAFANNKLKVPSGKNASFDLTKLDLKTDGTEYELSFDISVDSYVSSTNYNRAAVEFVGDAGTLYLLDILSYNDATKAEVSLLGQWKGGNGVKEHSVKFNYNPKTGLVSGAVGNWATQSKTWGAGSAATTLRFRANGQDTFYIDNVNIVEISRSDMSNWTYTGAELTGDKLKVPAGKNATLDLTSMGLKTDGTEYEVSFDISVDSYVSSSSYNRVGVELGASAGTVSVFDILTYNDATKAEVSLLGQWKGGNGAKEHSVKFNYNPKTGLISASVGSWASQSKTWNAGNAATTLIFRANGQDTFYIDDVFVKEIVPYVPEVPVFEVSEAKIYDGENAVDTLSGLKSASSATVKVDWKNTKEDASAMVVVVYYGEGGVLLDGEISSAYAMETKTANGTITYPLTKAVPEGAQTAKVMVWDNMTSLRPVTSAATFNN